MARDNMSPSIFTYDYNCCTLNSIDKKYLIHPLVAFLYLQLNGASTLGGSPKLKKIGGLDPLPNDLF